MSISHDEVERIVRLLEASQFDELHLELEGLKLDLRRRGAAPAVARQPPPAGVSAPPALAPLAAPTAPATRPVETSALLDIKAPMLGTFFLAPKPGADPFIAIGSRVDPDTVIGIVEVMKLMNSVSAGVTGEVAEIVASDGQLVEFDQVIVRIRPL